MKLATGKNSPAQDRANVLQALLENSPASMFALDRDYRYIAYNQAHARVMFKVHAAQIEPGEDILVYIHNPAERENLRQNLQRALSGETFQDATLSLQAAPGAGFTNIRYAPLMAKNGQIDAVSVISEDLNRQIQSSENEKNNLTLFHDLFENISSNILVIDPDSGAILEANLAACAFYGYSREKLTGLKIMDIVELPAQEVMARMRKVVAREVQHVVHTHRLSNGKTRQVDVYSGPYHLKDRCLLVSIIHDITERQQTETDLRKSQEILSFVLEGSQLGFFDWNILTGEITRNQHWAGMLGYRLEELETNIQQWENLIHPDDLQAALRTLQEHMQGRSPTHTSEYRLRCKDGSYKWVLDRARVTQYTAEGKPLRLSGTLADITAQKLAEAELLSVRTRLEEHVRQRTTELESANRALAQALRTRDDFLAAMSHELRTPLTGILGLSQSLQIQLKDVATPKQLTLLHTIEISGKRLHELINDVLDYSRFQAGSLQLTPNLFLLKRTCASSLQALQSKADSKHQLLTYTITPEDMVIKADERRIKQVITNLLGNAIKFTPEEGRIALEVTGDPVENHVRISVSDSGIGIRAQDIPLLFKPFTQLDTRLSREYSGTGLGLALVKNLAELHGGRVEVESVHGQGSRFIVILPWDGSLTA